MKRFYKTAEVVADSGRFAIALDGKAVRTPMGQAMALPSAALAEAVAGEWLAQQEVVRPKSMVLTSIVNTAIDRIGPNRPFMVEQLLRFAETDMLCYRVDQPTELAARQHTAWQPILDWAAAQFGADLATTTEVTAVAQPADSLAALSRALARHDEFRLAALSTAVGAMGSLILGLALAEGRLTADEAFALAQLEESFQNERWGEDDEAVSRRAGLRIEVEAAATVLRLHKG
jgi:chaperone required for assembly of F1-ATPase